MSNLFKKALILIILSTVLTMVGCSRADSTQDEEDSHEDGNESIIIPDAPSNIPPFKFSEISYSRPSFEEIESKYSKAIDAIERADSFDECITKINDAEQAAKAFMTMYSYATIRIHLNASDSFYSDEYSQLSEWYPAISKLDEELCIAAAASADSERYENEHFGEGLIEKYEAGGIYTEAAVKLLEDEAALISRYNSLSTQNVQIKYGGRSGSFDDIISALRTELGGGTEEYERAEIECLVLYEDEVKKTSADIFLALVKIRAEIAHELGYESYTEYAYEVLSHDYDREKIEALVDDIAEYAVPVYKKLSAVVFRSAPLKKADTPKVINALTTALKSMDGDLYDVYAYMLTSGLFDISATKFNRFDGSFTTYLNQFRAPFLFVTSHGNISDYMTLSHEFGHFYDYFLNGGDDASIDLAEISSQALEFLVLCELKDVLDPKEHSALFKFQMKSALETLIYQAFYTKLEHLIYDIDVDKITKESLDSAVIEAANTLSMNTDHYSSLECVMITHLFNSPLYVQSYATSILSSLEIFFAELDEEGAGVEIYRKLVYREEVLDYNDRLSSAGLSSPFAEGLIKRLSDKIHYTIMGSHFFDEYKNSDIVLENRYEFSA